MAVSVYEIKPAGGGDYTTLQACWDDTFTDANPMHMECYEGGDMGELDINTNNDTPGFTPDATDYVKIYAADGEQHVGILNTGCYVVAGGAIGIYVLGLDYTRIEGITVRQDNSYGVLLVDCEESYVKNCLIYDLGTASDTVGLSVSTISHDRTNHIINNILYSSNKTTSTVNRCFAAVCTTGDSTPTFTVNVYNNTFIGAYYTCKFEEIVLSKGTGAASIDLNFENNICMNSVAATIISSILNGTISASQNMDSDGSCGTVLGSDTDQANKDVYSQFKDAESNFNLLPTSDAIENGVVVGAVPTDYKGATRPYGTNPCIGADEYNSVASVVIREGVEIN